MRNKKGMILFICAILLTLQSCVSRDEAELDLDDDEIGNGLDDEVGLEEVENKDQLKIKNKTKTKYPFPNAINIFVLDKFFQLHQGIFQKYQPLKNELKLYSTTLNESDEIQPEALQSVKARVRELPEKAHWTYFYAVNELLHFLQQNSRTMLRVDLEENFVIRMRVVAQLSKELSEVLLDDHYDEVSKNLYISINERYLDRTVKPRNK